MIKNYLKIAWRNLMKFKLYSFLNITGLSVGILCSCMIYLYVNNELKYDNYHSKGDRIFRINFYGKLGAQSVATAQTPGPAGPTFKDAMPEIEEMCRLASNGRTVVKYENVSYNENSVLFADSTLFRFFNFPLLKGDTTMALVDPGTAVISNSFANKYFGKNDPIGKVIKVDNDKLYKITGVMQDIPANTHFACDLFLSMASREDSWAENWGSTNYCTYLLLKHGANINRLSEAITGIFVKNFSQILRQYLNTNWEEFTKAGNYAKLELFPMKKIHLHSQMEDELAVNGDIKYIYIFSITGILILFLACINFINLTTARASKRAKEVGIRKVVGAMRSGLAKQFLGESFLIGLFAWGLALLTAWLLLPFYNQLSGKQLNYTNLFSIQFLSASFLIMLIAGFLAGIYPAIFLSSFNPVAVLKGARIASNSKSILRNGLVVFQFFITTFLLVSAFVVYSQLNYIRHKNLGFNKEQLLIINDTYLLGNNLQTFKKKLLQMSSISNVSATNILPVNKENNNTSIIKGRHASNENTVLVNNFWVDADYVKTMGLEIVEGRDVSVSNLADSSSVIINQVLAKEFGYPRKSAVGQELSLPTDEDGGIKTYTITGVVKDYHFGSLRNKIGPLVLFPNGSANYIDVRFKTSGVAGLITSIQNAWKELASGQPFSYSFFDEKFEKIYEADKRIGKITTVFTIIAVIIACLGLLGLVTFMAEQRNKEIGIRKVLGADALNIAGLLARDFIMLVLIAVVLAFPVAWYAMHKWLDDFAYRINLNVWMFLIIAISVTMIALFTISFQAIKTAVANPVKSLRSE